MKRRLGQQTLLRRGSIPFSVIASGGSQRCANVDVALKCDAHLASKYAEAYLNINPDKDCGILNKCSVLNEYTQFIDKVRYFESINDESPISGAIKWCIENHVLEEFLREKGPEVKKVMTLDMTFEHRMEINRSEALKEGYSKGLENGRAEGKTEGRAEGRAEGKAEERASCIRNMLNSGIEPEKIEEICGYPLSEILKVKG